MEYSYYWVTKSLIEAGADETIKNSEGFEAGQGINGEAEQMTALDALADASTLQHVNMAMQMLEEADASTIDKEKAVKVMLAMKKKNAEDGLWPEEVNRRFRELIKAL
eukprot:scaffold1988_cov255-Pinguiococcus_pyrenoidosus.AAC.12